MQVPDRWSSRLRSHERIPFAVGREPVPNQLGESQMNVDLSPNPLGRWVLRNAQCIPSRLVDLRRRKMMTQLRAAQCGAAGAALFLHAAPLAL